jgi:hypothetical protein
VFASLEDLEARLGKTLSGPDGGRAESVLVDASRKVRAVLGPVTITDSQLSGIDLATSWDPEVAADTVAGIVLEAARRGFENPRGFASERIGDYSYQTAQQNTPGGVYLTADERSTLRSMKPASTSVEMYQGDFAATGYVPVEGGGDWFPMYAE